MWQDITLTIVSILFSYALIPQVYQGFRKKCGPISLQTSIITSIGLFIASLVYFSLGLWSATITSAIAAILWLLLLIQRIIY